MNADEHKIKKQLASRDRSYLCFISEDLRLYSGWIPMIVLPEHEFTRTNTKLVTAEIDL